MLFWLLLRVAVARVKVIEIGHVERHGPLREEDSAKCLDIKLKRKREESARSLRDFEWANST